MGYEEAREIVKDNIEYDILVQDPRQDREQLDEVVELIAETLCSRKKTIVIAGDEYPQVLENVRVTDKKAAQDDEAVQAAVKAVAEALGDTGRIFFVNRAPSRSSASWWKHLTMTPARSM